MSDVIRGSEPMEMFSSTVTKILYQQLTMGACWELSGMNQVGRQCQKTRINWTIVPSGSWKYGWPMVLQTTNISGL
ncbi:MAG: hypothetical protein A2338_09310 [Bacteroidetes bacterium RIFOXYB12_FULL_41_6]|nr:MAG: hypothetical protein A2338_09310 [Bacteroidetes bacterium RIFOXYB12_FULL_41_6]